MKKQVQRLLRALGWELRRYQPPLDPLACRFPDLEESDREIIKRARPYTMTSLERLANVVALVTYVVQNKIDGDFVECGVWRGGV